MTDSRVILDKSKINNELVLIEYPGLVKNDENMLKTLGGTTKLSEIFCNEKRRLELRFHPDNIYNKSTSGDLHETAGLLMKIKIRRPKNNVDENLDVKSEQTLTHFVEILGKCQKTYKFDSLCDYQYLPLHKNNETGKMDNIYRKVVPSGIHDHEIFSSNESPIFCPPQIFSRSDNVYHKIHRGEKDNKTNLTNEVLGIVRGKSDSTEFQLFNLTDPFPIKPNPLVAKKMMIKYISDKQLDKVKKLFDECPIWNRVALIYESGVSHDKMKCIIPSVAYYFTTGPWRTMYVRYGYDPRQDFQSRFYQTFDYRLRYATGIAEYVKSKSLKRKDMKDEPSTSKENQSLVQDLKYPYFEEGTLPRGRQCNFRYCDLRIPKIQELLKKISAPLPGVKCNEKTGWLPSGFDDLCRQIVANIIKEHMKIIHQQEKLKSTVGDDEEDIFDEEIDVDMDESENFNEPIDDDDEIEIDDAD